MENSHYRGKVSTVKMFYWLIPYLVMYNASDTVNWKFGPEHLFKVEVRGIFVIGNDTSRSEVDMFISCRPMNLSFIQCRVESATIDDYEFSADSYSVKSESHQDFEIGNVIFQVEFDKMGARNVTLLNAKGFFQENIIRSIVDEFNIGTDLSNKKSGKKYFFDEKSVNGICETCFDIGNTKLPHEEEDPAAIDGFNFYVPSFLEREENKPIIIGKKRKINDCSVKTHYFFGSREEDGSYLKPTVKIENNITRSQSIIYLGKNGFTSYSKNEGTLEIKSDGTYSKHYGVGKPSKSKITQTLRLKLVAIRPATEKL